ncbi:MAG: 2-hydroxypropyl-CoM lyase [Deltaproteobacteria bacterium]|jgi:5-methyltetrahydropteroyltriglutamate--homocysteine methyltransferase|nr:2-hydroxypropyl-CoM lyase [Deltaproteobacteria bacterium]
MKLNKDRILTTHVGSLPRSEKVFKLIFAKEAGEELDKKEYDKVIADAVKTVVVKQEQAGIDVVSDGEQSKISYATYIKDRLNGFEGDSPRRTPKDLEEFPAFSSRASKSGGVPTYSRPQCTGQVSVKDMEPLEIDLQNFRVALKESSATDAFMNAASPGVIALFQPNQYYTDHKSYLYALAEAMKVEYEGIAKAGFLIQIDSPDLALGRHVMFKDKSDQEFISMIELHIEALNHALENIPAEQIRLHVCWGNYQGPHHCDIEMKKILPSVLKAKPQALSFEGSNPRHSHEWTVFRDTDIPEDKILIPGVLDSTTNFVEHPELVAERICRFADIVGRERVIAGTDCGFSTFAGFGTVDAEITYTKLESLSKGAELASEKLW